MWRIWCRRVIVKQLSNVHSLLSGTPQKAADFRDAWQHPNMFGFHGCGIATLANSWTWQCIWIIYNVHATKPCITLNNKNQKELVTCKTKNENNKPIFIRWKVGLLVIRDASFTISGPYSCLRIVRTSWNSISTSQSFKLQPESIFVWLCLTFPIRFFLILFDIYWDSSFGVQCLIIFRQKTFVSMRQTSNAFAPPRSRVAPSRNSMSLKLANPISTKTKPTQNGCVIVCLKMRFLTREVCVWGNPSVFRGFVSGYASRLSPQVEKENEGSVSGVRFRGKFRQTWTSQHYALSSTQRLQTIINTARL